MGATTSRAGLIGRVAVDRMLVGCTAWAFMLAAVCGAVAGCGEGASSGEEQGASSIDEMTQHRGEVCPGQLPVAPVSTHGFGTDTPAASAPRLAEPDSAWVCQYAAVDAGAGPGGNGTTIKWVRTGTQRPVEEHALPALADSLTELRPAEGDRVCTSDLGPRWMPVYSIGKDLTGVVVDAYGCSDIRLTDDPFSTVPGEATQPGTVSGVLVGPVGMLGKIKGG
jgi:hypothetical protein